MSGFPLGTLRLVHAVQRQRGSKQHPGRQVNRYSGRPYRGARFNRILVFDLVEKVGRGIKQKPGYRQVVRPMRITPGSLAA
ncbi:MAG: hypothetical protein HGA28_07700 [Anaerolineaceae bacterium]|nr:hypothetical protein [Anaerolineaceae bacterium]